MFAKVFAQIFDSSIAQDYTVRHMFMDLLVLADPTGAVDMTYDAISRRTNVPLETVRRCICELSQPDADSRSHVHDGKRLVPIDPQRNWGWLIVNYDHYRAIRDEEARRAYFRDYQRERRAKPTKKGSSTVVKDKKLTGVNKTESSSSTSPYESPSKKPATEAEVIEFCLSAGIPDGSFFWHKWEGNGFTNSGKPIKSWKSVIRQWKSAGWCPSQKAEGPHSKPTSPKFIPFPDDRPATHEETIAALKAMRRVED